MIADIGTVTWKEWKELLLARGSLRASIGSVLLNLGVFGVFLPWQFGLDWLDSLWTAFWVLFVASFWTTSVIADSFAGERERHTLETLLASRLSNRAILFGKYNAAVLYVTGQILVSLLAGLLVVNVAHVEGGFRFYRASVAAAALGAALLGPGLVAGIGILISLRAGSVRQAQQTLLIPLTVLLVLPSIAVLAVPAELQARFFAWIVEADVTGIALGAIVFLFLVDAALLAAGLRRFRRDRLILD
jgi:ABC-2 type transport system permease protein